MVGLVTGVAFGVAVHNVIVGVILGFFIGSGVGATIYRKHRQQKVDLDQILWASTPLLVFIGLTAIIWLDILAL
jgi:hypothetical protein